jgi:hypothetical protein
MTEPLRAHVPADVEAPDRLLYGLTARQVAILGAAAAAAYLLFQTLRDRLPMPILVAGLIPILGAGAVLALGRRDGLSLDRWLAAALRGLRTPRRQVSAAGPIAPPPGWAPTPDQPQAAPAPLRLPAQAVDQTGLVDLGGGRTAALTAATTVNLALRTGIEQRALVAGFARWLNSLSTPTQIVVNAQPVNLVAHAQRLAEQALLLPHPALSQAALDHAEFLVALELQREPLGRTVTIVHTSTTGGREAARLAEQTAGALQALGADTTPLDGARVLGVLEGTADPYRYADPHPNRAVPDQPTTGQPTTGQVQP